MFDFREIYLAPLDKKSHAADEKRPPFREGFVVGEAEAADRTVLKFLASSVQRLNNNAISRSALFYIDSGKVERITGTATPGCVDRSARNSA